MKNKLVVFEGIDGVGKSSLCRQLKTELGKRGIRAVIFEDYEKKIKGFNKLKPFIRNKVAKTSIDSSLLFYLSSAVYKSEIIKKLLKKNWVICDRYVYSTIAYHKVRGASKNLIPELIHFPVRKPDYGFFVTIDDKIRLERMRKREIVNKNDLVPKKRGNFIYKMEEELKRFGLIRIDNSQNLDVALKIVLIKTGLTG